MLTRSQPHASAKTRSSTSVQREPPKLTASGLLLAVVLGAIIGGLIAKLGGSEFGRYVSTFYSRSSTGFQVLSRVSEIAHAIRPLAWFGPTLGGLYACWRCQSDCFLILIFGIVGWLLGALNSAYVMADPGPNFHTGIYTIPIGCFAGTLVGWVVQVARGNDRSGPD